MADLRRRWIIDVCKTCDRLAQWPFCEHRAKTFASKEADNSWYEAVTVVEVRRNQKESE